MKSRTIRNHPTAKLLSTLPHSSWNENPKLPESTYTGRCLQRYCDCLFNNNVPVDLSAVHQESVQAAKDYQNQKWIGIVQDNTVRWLWTLDFNHRSWAQSNLLEMPVFLVLILGQNRQVLILYNSRTLEKEEEGNDELPAVFQCAAILT